MKMTPWSVVAFPASRFCKNYSHGISSHSCDVVHLNCTLEHLPTG